MKNTISDVPQTPSIQYKLTQSYQIASAVSAGGQVESICNGNGQVELFTIGSDGTVWNFYPDPTSDTGYNGQSLNIKAGAIATGLDANGHVVVFIASALQLFFIVETGVPSNRWSQPTLVTVPQPANATRIARIVTRQIGGSLYVGVLTAYSSVLPNNTSFAYSIWAPDAPSFIETSFILGSLHCVWLGNSTQTAAFACVDMTIVAFSTATSTVQHYPMAGTFQTTDVDSANDGTGADQVIAILADGNAYRLMGGNGKAYSWGQLSQGLVLRQIRAIEDQSGQVQVFGLLGSNELCHWVPEPASMSGYSFPPTILQTNVTLMDAVKNDAGAVDLFLVGTAHNTLTRLMADEVSGNWQSLPIEVPTAGTVEEFVAYTTDLYAYDAEGAVLVSAPVKVQTTEAAKLVINGSTFFMEPGNVINTSTNAAGLLSVAQATSHLSAASIQITYPGSSISGQPILLDSSSDIKTKLSSTTGTNLMNATISGGNFLLSPPYRTTETTDSLAKAINQCMQVNYAASLEQLQAPSSAPQHWQLQFGADNSVIYQTLSLDEVDTLLATKHRTLVNSMGVLDWLGTIGDFIEQVGNGIANVVDIVAKTVGNAINAAITFVVDGITYLFNATISFVKQAFDLVETLLAQVKVAFEQLFEWLGELFNWNDILRTHQAVVYSINQFLTFMQGSVGGLQNLVDTGITNLQTQVNTLFQKAIANLAGQSSVGGFVKSNEKSSPKFSNGVANNLVFNGLINNASGATTLSVGQFVKSGPVDAFMQQLDSFAAQVQGIPAFANASTYFQQIGSSPDQIFTNLFSGLLEIINGLMQAVLLGLKAIADALLQLVQELIGAFQQILNESWSIPFVSEFYAWITNGATLTTIDLFALMLAIPMTLLYKLTKEAAPFPDAASVTAFENSFNAQSMLNAAGFGNSGALVDKVDSGLMVSSNAFFFGLGTAAATALFALVSAVTDAVPKESPPILSKVSFLLEIGWQMFSFPWVYTTGGLSCTTADGTNKVIWLYQILGIALDGLFIWQTERKPEYGNDIGVVVAFIYGCVHLILGVVSCLASDQTPGGQAATLIPILPEIIRLGRLEAIQKGTGEISLAVVGAVDILCYLTSAILSYLLLVTSSTEDEVLTLIPAHSLSRNPYL